MLADRLLAHLDALGLCCTRVVVEAETEHGERLTRCWRHEGALTPATLVARVRWQLDVWLLAEGRAETRDDAAPDDVVTAGLVLLRLAPDDLGPATGRQLGFWGGNPAAADRAGRALARVQGMLGPDAVVTAVAVGGRTPVEQVRWVPWGEERGDPAAGSPPQPWPGAVPGPAPARIFDPPVAAELVDDTGAPVTVSGRGEPSGAPAGLWCAVLPGGGGPLVAWNGPWAHDLRWWDARRRRALWQVVVAGADDAGDGGAGVACLVVLERGRRRGRSGLRLTPPAQPASPAGVLPGVNDAGSSVGGVTAAGCVSNICSIRSGHGGLRRAALSHQLLLPRRRQPSRGAWPSRRRRLGLTALAVTDHDGLYGAVRFALAAARVRVCPRCSARS